MNEALKVIRGERTRTAADMPLVELLREFDRSDAVENQHRPRTAYKYRNMSENFTRYLEQTGELDVTVRQASVQLLKYFAVWLPEHLRSCDRTHISKHVYRINRALNYAALMGYIPYNPCAAYKVKRARVGQVVALERQELEKWIAATWHSEPYRRAQVNFTFQALTGISYGDLFPYQTARDERGEWIEGPRTKNGFMYHVPLWHEYFERARAIHEQYHGALPFIENHYYNRLLKEMAAALGIRKRLTTHVARKTFATIAKADGYPTPWIAAVLGNTEKVCRTSYISPSKDNIVAELLRRGA